MMYHHHPQQSLASRLCQNIFKFLKLYVSNPACCKKRCTRTGSGYPYECDLAGPVTLVGAGAGRVETGYSLLIDLINIERGGL